MCYIYNNILYSIITTNGKTVKLSHPAEHSTKGKSWDRETVLMNYS